MRRSYRFREDKRSQILSRGDDFSYDVKKAYSIVEDNARIYNTRYPEIYLEDVVDCLLEDLGYNRFFDPKDKKELDIFTDRVETFLIDEGMHFIDDDEISEYEDEDGPFWIKRI